MLFIERGDERWIQNKGSRDPGAFFWSVPFPVDQILEPTTTALDIQDATSGVGRVDVDDPGGWRVDGRRAQRILRNRFNLGHMKSGVDFHSCRQKKSFSRWIDYAFDKERPDESGCQFPRCVLIKQEMGGEKVGFSLGDIR